MALIHFGFMLLGTVIGYIACLHVHNVKAMNKRIKELEAHERSCHSTH